MIKTQEVAALYISNWSRASRDEDLQHGLTIRQICRARRVLIRTPERWYDLDSEDDDMLADIQFIAAKNEKRSMNRRMAQGQYTKAARGGFPGGRPRFGYRFKYVEVETPRGPKLQCDIEPDPVEIKIARLIHENFTRFSTCRWARILNRLAKWGCAIYFPIKGRKDRERMGSNFRAWRQEDIANIVRNRWLVGRLVYCVYDSTAYRNGQRKRSRHLRQAPPAITLREDLRVLDDATFERNNRLLDERSQTPSRTIWSPHAFSGVLHCPDCGGILGHNGSNSEAYFCQTARWNGMCRGFTVCESAARDTVVPLVSELLQLNLAEAVKAVRHGQTTDRVATELRIQIEQIDHEIENLMTFARQGAISIEQLREQNRRLLAAKQEKQTRLDRILHSNADQEKLNAYTEEFLGNLPDFMMYLYQEETHLFNQVLRLVFGAVTLDSKHRGQGWKKGLKLGSKKGIRPYHLKSVAFEPRFEEWTHQYGFVVPERLRDLAYGTTMTGVPVFAQSCRRVAGAQAWNRHKQLHREGGPIHIGPDIGILCLRNILGYDGMGSIAAFRSNSSNLPMLSTPRPG